MNIPRKEYVDSIHERLHSNPIVALTGPRQVGKTTLARHMASISARPVHLFDLESPKDIAKLANPELALAPLEGLVILDEIQRAPELYPVLRVLADRPGKETRFLILGSASSNLVKGVSESLAGRVSFIDVHGLSLQEVGKNHMHARWWRGGFPPAFLAPTHEVARQWHEDFIRTFLEQDIPQLGLKIPAQTLRRSWTMLAHFHGQVLNVAELARSLGTSEPTARRYTDLLAGTFMVRQLPPWFENLKKRQVKSPKVYVRDSGICHTLLGVPNQEDLLGHPKVGASWEGFCLEQILSVTGDRHAYFWATHAGAELDLLLFHQGKRLGVEFKFTERPATSKSMRAALADLTLDHLYVVFPGTESIPLDPHITALPLPNLLNEFQTG